MITGVEALLRWSSPALGQVGPDRFIPVAEDAGLIGPIGDWVLQSACEQVMTWQRQGLGPLCLSVNLSARQFSDPHLNSRVDKALKNSGLAPSQLELEITESTVMQDPLYAIDLIRMIKYQGVRFALDDFGTGHSSLGQLKNCPIDTLKIDRAFMQELPDSEQDRAIARAIISMARTLGLHVVAEGVENTAQLEFLKEERCDHIQGYYFQPPLPPETFERVYRKHAPQHHRLLQA